MLILDEAHHAAPSSGQRYAIASQITRAIQGLSPRFEHRLFLSATPHNGHSNSFSALLSLLDNQRFTPGVPVNPKLSEPALVRRLKDDLRTIRSGFPGRLVAQDEGKSLPEESPSPKPGAPADGYRDVRGQPRAA